MKHLRRFSLFSKAGKLTKEQEKFLNEFTQGSWKVNPTTGLVDVDGNFYCTEEAIKNLAGIRFGLVSGSFHLSNNQLTSLEGAPREVGGNFQCSNNQLTSLEGAPVKVGRGFYCTRNRLTSLEGAPREVGGNFNCSSNQLTSLEGGPLEVGGDFSCYGNYFRTLKGAPERVGGDFHLGFRDVFKWTAPGKLEYIFKDRGWASLIIPTISYESLLEAVSDNPIFLKVVEGFDKTLYNKLLKDLGWDKMGPDLLRQLKDGIL